METTNLKPFPRSINWLEDTGRSLSASFPALGHRDSLYIARRLSRLVLDRLPPEVGRALLALLPGSSSDGSNEPELIDLYLAADRPPDLSIGYPAFVESVAHSMHEPERSLHEEEFLERVADYFLWSFAQEFPPELKDRIVDHLPLELRNRMNLRSSHADESKVA